MDKAKKTKVWPVKFQFQLVENIVLMEHTLWFVDGDK